MTRTVIESGKINELLCLIAELEMESTERLDCHNLYS